MDYHNYTTIDFATDDAFLRWVLAPDEAGNAQWEQWVKEHPEQKPIMEQARRLILSITPQQAAWSAERQLQVKENIMAQVLPENKIPIRKRFWTMGKAAAFIGLLLVSLGLWVTWKSRTLHFKTGYGVTEEVHLPDGSIVILNANSELSYQEIIWSKERIARLSGEAFFQVKRTADSSHFIVKSGEVVTEVLGTEFVIRARRDTTQVVLTSGSIRLHLEEEPDLRENALTLSPGELVEYAQTNVIRKEQVDPKLYAGLRDHMLILNKTPLGEVATQVYDIYGYTLHFPAGMEDESFTAKIPLNMDGMELLETLLSESFRLEVKSKTDSSLVFEK